MYKVIDGSEEIAPDISQESVPQVFRVRLEHECLEPKFFAAIVSDDCALDSTEIERLKEDMHEALRFAELGEYKRIVECARKDFSLEDLGLSGVSTNG